MKHDVVIIGAGPAGISCALELFENKINPIVIDRSARVGGQLPLIPSPIHNFSGGTYTDGLDAQVHLEKTAKDVLPDDSLQCGVEVLSVDLEAKVLKTSIGTIEARSIVIATGYRIRKLDSNIENRFAEDVIYKSGIYKEELVNKEVIVVGGGDSALMTALDLADVCRVTTLVVRSSNYRARPDVVADVKSNQKISVLEEARIRSLSGNGHLQEAEIDLPNSVATIPCQKAIVKIGYLPNTEFVKGQVEMDQSGHIISDQLGSTSVDGIFAAGDIIHNGYDRIAYATGSGMASARGVRIHLGHRV